MLADDALILLVGPSGAGKSTWASGRFRPYEVLESDAFRAMVADDATDQAATADAFKLLHAVTRARTRRGLRTVVDATNLTAGARRALLRIATRASRPVVAVIFDVSLERCLTQNEKRRGRRVPGDVIRRQHGQLRAARRDIDKEGYATVFILRDDDLPAADGGAGGSQDGWPPPR
ncbi:MAG: AAA family ATPase [Chloroflexota bacterium]